MLGSVYTQPSVSHFSALLHYITYRIIHNSKLYSEEQGQNHSKSKRRDRSNLSARRDTAGLELPTEKLLRWRKAVNDATSASQLAMCMCELERCVAWEKSSTVVVSGEGGERWRVKGEGVR